MKTDAQWQAEEDARTLARAEEIKADDTRMTRAQTAAKQMVKEEEDRLAGIRKVAGKSAAKTKIEGQTSHTTQKPLNTSQGMSQRSSWQNR